MRLQVSLKRNEEKRIKAGHLWIFSNEIEALSAPAENGDLVEVFDSKKEFIGTGFYNKNSLISVRILSRSVIHDLQDVLKNKIISAYNLRKEIYPGRESFRLAFSESDFIPGLIIDKYNNSFVLQVYSYGIQKNIDAIVRILSEELKAENIFSKHEAYFRKLEGLPEDDEVYLGNLRSERISDGAITYDIDFEKGHKTGFYFDQNDNRFFIEKIVNGKNVLDGFCNSGGFGLHAARAGAQKVTFVDASKTEVENAEKNFALNNLSTEAEFDKSDVFDFLEEKVHQNEKYDVVMIDPPAFAKSKKNLPAARKGYEKLNRLALQCTANGGYLVTSSCSHHLKKEEFLSLISAASIRAGKEVQLIHINGASLDHPQLPVMEETSYLKFAVFRVI